MGIDFSSNKLLIWFWELVGALDIISLYEKGCVELLTCPFKGILKLGPAILSKSSNSTTSTGKSTWKASGSFTVVTKNNSDFILMFQEEIHIT